MSALVSMLQTDTKFLGRFVANPKNTLAEAGIAKGGLSDLVQAASPRQLHGASLEAAGAIHTISSVSSANPNPGPGGPVSSVNPGPGTPPVSSVNPDPGTPPVSSVNPDPGTPPVSSVNPFPHPGGLVSVSSIAPPTVSSVAPHTISSMAPSTIAQR